MTNHVERAFRLWPFLVDAATRKSTVTYGDAAEFLAIHHRPIRYVLGPIQSHCLEYGLPPITSLVVNAKTGMQGTGYLGEPGQQADIEAVWQFDWSNLPNPFSELTQEEIDDASDQLIEDPESADELMSLVRSRGDQQRLFRAALLKAYQSKCAICKLSFVECLEAAHIVKWSSASPQLRIDPRNGVLLCANHHRLYDSGWIDILENFKVEYCDSDCEEETYTQSDKDLSLKFDGKKLNLPRNKKLWPAMECIRIRSDSWED